MQSSMIGAYGKWAASIVGDEPARLSFRRPEWTDVDAWRPVALRRVTDCLAEPDIGHAPAAEVRRRHKYDGLDVEELSWQLPYGPPTEAVFMKPEGATGRLPGVLALHDHGGFKYFGWRKISRVADETHSLVAAHQKGCYGSAAWANRMAKRGYAVLAHDAFAFGSRRVLLADVPEEIRGGLTDPEPTDVEGIQAYNAWTGTHESLMAKALFSAGTTWPGVWLAEDRVALDVLCARDDVDARHVGCGGLSGGGLRTVYLAGTDARVRCAACAGMMTTWRDYILNRCQMHTWMIYIPHLPRDLDYPEILGLRAPLPTLVLNNIDDPLFTMPEMERADRMLRDVFNKAGAGDRYQSSFYPGPHKFDLEMQSEVFDWFDRWLKEP